jgi:hypothetical protein
VAAVTSVGNACCYIGKGGVRAADACVSPQGLQDYGTGYASEKSAYAVSDAREPRALV